MSAINPTEDELIAALAAHFAAPEAAAIAWLSALANRFDARAAQERLAARNGTPTGWQPAPADVDETMRERRARLLKEAKAIDEAIDAEWGDDRRMLLDSMTRAA